MTLFLEKLAIPVTILITIAVKNISL